MWVKALDIVLDRLVVQGAELSTVVAVSGSAQQHGSLYWSSYGIKTLSELDADKFLHTQIDDSAFTITRTPIWMDGSTEKQCIEMEEAIGGRDKMVEYTGSKCYSRFTGPQIRKIYQTRSDSYENTKRISLVSSFLASLFLGQVAPIDYSDGSGMNLLDITKKCWSQPCLNACAPDLEERLGEPVPTNSVIGEIGSFFVQRYSFNPRCKIVCFTGDNPSALAGLLVAKNMLAMSLGTSDTIMMTLNTPTKMEEGHVLVHPTDDGYMGLLCFRNGSLTRDLFKRVEGNDSWEYFSELLDSTPRGNFGNMALHYPQQEIIPQVKGSLRWNKLSNSSDPELAKGVSKFSSPQTEIRALIEGQMIHHKSIASDMGFSFGEDTKILTTGGGSENKSILQVASDVFNAPVYTQKSSEAAVLGAAFRAKYVHYITDNKNDEKESYFEYISKFLPHHMQRICDPSVDSAGIYTVMQQRYLEMVHVLQDIVSKNNNK
ncbi:hypothetical protein HA402_003612 [Bradysia odoriphaga]|nr:hypothetical protein HA402_003612 [Bradysia odoriphaga]